MRRTDTDGEGNSDANQSASLSGGPPLGPKIISFPRQPSSAASGGLVAGGDPMPPPAHFVRLGDVQAVVLRLKDNRLRLKVAAGPREEDKDRQR